MLRRGEIYENPVTTVRTTILLGTSESEGRRLLTELNVRKCGAGPALHAHPNFSERITVLSGRIALSIAGKTAIADPGSSVEIPPGVLHRWWNAGIYEGRLMIDIEPAGRFEEYFRTVFCLAQDGKTDSAGMPHLLQLAALVEEFSDVIYFPKPTKWVPGALLPALSPVARLFGYRGSYSEYLKRPPSRVLDADSLTHGGLDSVPA
jgi:quercetin dioxygenase-like cupin family protein